MSLDFLDADDWEPALGEHPTWSMEEIESHPLFMTDLPENPTNVCIEALQSVLYDGDSPYEIAHNFKEQGNSALARGLIDDAIIFYSKGLEIECTDVVLLSQIHCNLALALLKKSLFPQCVDQCYRAIGYDTSNVKAFYRGALASFKLDLYSQGIYFAKGGLDVDKDNEPLCELLASLTAAKLAQDASRAAASTPVAAKPKYRWNR